MSPCLKFSPEVKEVVDLAVEDDLDGAVLVADGLPASKEVYDAQAAVAKTDTLSKKQSFFIRAAVREASYHFVQDGPFGNFSVRDMQPAYAAHPLYPS